MAKKSSLAWGIAGTMLALPAHAQNTKGTIDQIGGQGAVPVEQIASGQERSSARAETRNVAAPQLTTGTEVRIAAPQVTVERGDGRGSAQLYTGGRTAEPAAALSRPSDGRTGAVAKVEGNDRCDPARRAENADLRTCARVIEGRAGEFVRRNGAELSFEEKLLIEQRNNQPSTTREAARQLGETGLDAGSLQAQGVAAVVLRGSNLPPETGDPSESADPAVNAAALNAIVNAIAAGANGGAPR